MQSQSSAVVGILYLLAEITADGSVFTDYNTQELSSGLGTTNDILICL